MDFWGELFVESEERSNKCNLDFFSSQILVERARDLKKKQRWMYFLKSAVIDSDKLHRFSIGLDKAQSKRLVEKLVTDHFIGFIFICHTHPINLMAGTCSKPFLVFL
jgi:hypothetical protein